MCCCTCDDFVKFHWPSSQLHTRNEERERKRKKPRTCYQLYLFSFLDLPRFSCCPSDTHSQRGRNIENIQLFYSTGYAFLISLAGMKERRLLGEGRYSVCKTVSMDAEGKRELH